jgi:FtsH-binding integral membrane protein
MRQVYTWMVLGMLITTVVAFVTASTSLINLAANPIILLIAVLAEFGLVLGISAGLNRLSAGVATLLFMLYAALNGFTLSMILLAFTGASLFLTFATTAALFGVMSIIGYTTKVDLSRMGTYLMMGVIGLVIAMVVNIFVGSGPLDTIISVVGVLIFTALTAYDTQRIGRMAAQMNVNGDSEVKFGIFGALKLYLDFINMFLFVLRLTGRRR